MHFDGSKMRLGLGAGIVLSSPKGDWLRYALQIHFTASNNVAKYEALLHGLPLAKELENEAANTLTKIASSRQTIPPSVSLEHLHKPSVKPSPDSESIYVPDDPAAPQPGPGTADPSLGTVKPGSGAAEPGPGAVEPGPGAAAADPTTVIPSPAATIHNPGAADPEPVMVAVFAVVMAPSWALPTS
nr:uncharacterized protein LOC109784010 [Aegilops tauschii subsp. strangulata]